MLRRPGRVVFPEAEVAQIHPRVREDGARIRRGGAERFRRRTQVSFAPVEHPDHEGGFRTGVRLRDAVDQRLDFRRGDLALHAIDQPRGLGRFDRTHERLGRFPEARHREEPKERENAERALTPSEVLVDERRI